MPSFSTFIDYIKKNAHLYVMLRNKIACEEEIFLLIYLANKKVFIMLLQPYATYVWSLKLLYRKCVVVNSKQNCIFRANVLCFKLQKNCHRPTPQNKRSRNCMSTKLILFIFKPQKRLHCSTKSEVKKNWILTDYIFNFFLEMSFSQFWYKITKKCNNIIRDKSKIFLHGTHYFNC